MAVSRVRPGLIALRRPAQPRGPLSAAAIVKRVGPPLLFALALIGLWQLYTAVSGVKESSLPAPSRVVTALFDERSLLLSNGWTTVTEIALGYLAAVAIGVGLAVVVATSRVAERAMYPWLVISQTIPVPAVAPIFVVWTGFDIRPKLMVIALTTFFPIAVNTIDGLKSADPELINLMRTLGAGRWRRFRSAQLPAALPFLFSGLKVGAALSVIGAVFAEWVGSSDGLGYLILTFNQQTQTASMFATVTVLAAIGIALFFLVSAIERVALPWYHATRSDGELR
jgi:ABC-type nitrate/sulfonate/bicarbonate transport system permease component